jgi:hypothetical protein
MKCTPRDRFTASTFSLATPGLARLRLFVALIAAAGSSKYAQIARGNRVTTQPLTTVWNDARVSQPCKVGSPRGRKPGRKDYLLFLLVVPLLISMWVAALGLRPVGELGFAGGWLYLGSRILVAWWGAHLAALAAGYLVRHRNWRLWQILLLGFLMAWLPLTVLFQLHLLIFSGLYPDHIASLSRHEMSFSGDYLWRLFSRSAVPFLPLWMAAVHAYRRQFGVDWYTCRNEMSMPPPAAADLSTGALHPSIVSSPDTGKVGAPSFLQQSKLPSAARLQTLKAAEHYIEVVTDCGNDLLRYRFNDAIRDMQSLDSGAQVHRSWWVSWDCVARTVQRSGKLELLLHDGRTIPVSMAYKSEVRRRFSRGNHC